MTWLLETATRKRIEQAQRSGVTATAENKAEIEARVGRDSSGNYRILTLAGNQARIAVHGVLTKKPDFFAMFFGGGNTIYPEIAAALAEVDANPGIASAILDIDSPGGTFEGLFDTLAAIELFSKPLTTRVGGMAASAAYALAAKTDSITASSHADQIGSIGIVVTSYIPEDMVNVTSTAAPKKRPDLTTEAGRATLREELDALHEIFADAIAQGRGTTVANVNARYGQGATLLAEAALDRGMIDAIAGAPRLRIVEPLEPETENPMDIPTLKTQHPDVYAAAVQAGADEERDRASAHLTLGEASGDLKTAITAVKEGTAMTATITATYMAAGMNRRDTEDRQADDLDASAAADSADSKASDLDDGASQVADILVAKLGLKEE